MIVSKKFEKLLRQVAKDIGVVLGTEAHAAALRRVEPFLRHKPAKKLRGVKRTGPNKTALMLRVLADGKPHPATQLALAGGTTVGHVHTHLAGRMKKGLVKRIGPGIFQLTVKKAKKAA